MNVLHLTHTDINSDSRILKEIQSIAQSNNTYNVCGIGVMQSGQSVYYTSNVENINIYSIALMTRKWRFLPSTLRHICTFFELSIKMILKSVSLKPNILHCNDNWALLIGVIVKLFTGSKLIYDAHELESDRNGISKILAKFIFCSEKMLWGFVDYLIVVTPSIEKWYLDNIGDKQSEVILNSPVWEEQDAIVKDSTYFRDHFSISKDSRIFLYIGNLVNGRGIPLIVNAFKDSDLKSSLVFLGDGELSDELRVISQKYPNIYVHDAVPHEKVVSIAKSADVGLCLIQNVSLSDYYCLPNKLFEYCFAEIPVLASNFPDISNVVEKYHLGKCCSLDSESIYSSIKYFEDMDELIKVDAGSLYELSWEVQGKKLVKLYNKLA